MRLRGATFWGAALVVLGLLFLLANLGWLTVDVWNLALPLLLVLLGALTLWAATRPAAARAVQELRVPLRGTSQVQLRVRFGAGRLTLGGADRASALVDGRFGGGVEVREEGAGGERLELRVPHDFFGRFFTPWNWFSGAQLEWDVRLNDQVRYDLDLESGASEMRIDLRSLQVERFRLSCGASSVEATMPDGSGLTRATIETGAASVVVRIPDGVEARIRSSAGLAEVRVDLDRFPRSGDGYESAGYAGATNRIDLKIEAGMASVEVR